MTTMPMSWDEVPFWEVIKADTLRRVRKYVAIARASQKRREDRARRQKQVKRPR